MWSREGRTWTQGIVYAVEMQFIPDPAATLLHGERKEMHLSAGCRVSEVHLQSEKKVGTAGVTRNRQHQIAESGVHFVCVVLAEKSVYCISVISSLARYTFRVQLRQSERGNEGHTALESLPDTHGSPAVSPAWRWGRGLPPGFHCYLF